MKRNERNERSSNEGKPAESLKAKFEQAFKLIKQADNIAIAGHVHPDGDCIGSALALYALIKKLNKNVGIYMEDAAPKQFSYLDGYKIIKGTYPKATKFDLLITVDFNTSDRMGEIESIMQASKKVICFDHHLGFDIKSDIAVTDSKFASCGEIIYEFFKANNIEITKGMADALYTAVSTDTACFLYPNTTSHSHIVAAALLDLGADLEKINYINFRVYGAHFLSGLKQILRDLRFKCDGQISYTRLKNSSIFDETERHKFKQYISDIRGVRASIFIAQEGRNEFHVSLRSHGDVNVEIPARIFGGGGHKNASGFTITGHYKTIIKRTIVEVEKIVCGRNP